MMKLEDAVHYEAANDLLIRFISYFGRPKWASKYLACKVFKKYKKYQKRLEWSDIIKKI
jgi:hypothetical protein